MRLRPAIALPALCGFLLACSTVSAAPAPKAEAAGTGAPAKAVYSALAGAWVGALEYRDYSSNERVFLPTILHIRRAKDGRGLTLHYIYDDGPTKVVQDFETVTVDPAAGTYITVSGDGKDTTTDTLTGLAAFAKSGQGVLTRSSKGTENDKPVDVHTTMTVAPRTLTITKETRLPGQTYLFRDQYTLTRVGPVSTGK